MKAMLLAAGLGTRLRPLTEDRPKALTEIDGESLIARHVRRLVTAGVSDIVINLSYRGEKIREHLGTGQRHGAKIVYSDEGEQPLETGGGVLAALPLLGGEPFLLVNSDVVTDFDFAILEPGRRLGTLVLVPNPPHHPAGDFGLDAQSLLTDTEPRLTFSGISVLDPAVFANCRPGRQPLKPILDAQIANRALAGLRYDSLWIDVGTEARLEQARTALRAAHA
jgi:MurNAc alpha-1-phosphate uridylyltransferase